MFLRSLIHRPRPIMSKFREEWLMRVPGGSHLRVLEMCAKVPHGTRVFGLLASKTQTRE